MATLDPLSPAIRKAIKEPLNGLNGQPKGMTPGQWRRVACSRDDAGSEYVPGHGAPLHIRADGRQRLPVFDEMPILDQYPGDSA